MRDISEIRQDINQVDDELKNLFLKRMEYVEQVREYKQVTNTPVKNKGREDDILKSKLLGIDKFRGETEEFFKSMIEISCNYQEQHLTLLDYKNEYEEVCEKHWFSNIKTVAYQGIAGSYSYEATSEFFDGRDITNCNSFKEVVQNVINGNCDVGVLPVENLAVGCVTDVYDLLKEYDVYTFMCYGLNITHCLAGRVSENNITDVISHPQALGQCSKYIESKKLNKHECSNTAVAAKMVAEHEDNNFAAICSKSCANLYGLDILKEDISDIKPNMTKFIFVSKKPIIMDTADRVSIIFTLKHEAGSLSRVLNDFAKNDINLTKIESRPSKDDEWKYVFYVELMLPEFDILEYFSRIRYMFDDFKVSGIYKNLG